MNLSIGLVITLSLSHLLTISGVLPRMTGWCSSAAGPYLARAFSFGRVNKFSKTQHSAIQALVSTANYIMESLGLNCFENDLWARIDSARGTLAAGLK